MNKKNLIERDREKLTAQENAHNIIFSKSFVSHNYFKGGKE